MNNNLNIIQDLIQSCSTEQIDKICDIIVNQNNNYIQELKNITNFKNVNNISYLVKYPYYKKNVELKTWVDNKLVDIMFNYVVLVFLYFYIIILYVLWLHFIFF